MESIDVRQLGRSLAGTDIALLELRAPDGQVLLWRNDVSAVEADAAEAAPTPTKATRPAAKAQSVGIFLDRHPLRASPFVRPGDAVVAGQLVGLLQVGALLLSVTAPAEGVVGTRRVAPGEAVGFGTELIDFERT